MIEQFNSFLKRNKDFFTTLFHLTSSVIMSFSYIYLIALSIMTILFHASSKYFVTAYLNITLTWIILVITLIPTLRLYYRIVIVNLKSTSDNPSESSSGLSLAGIHMLIAGIINSITLLAFVNLVALNWIY
jgi:hypothetical protein